MPAQSNPLRELIDGHAHLNEIDDIEGALGRAAAAGVARIVAVGMDIALQSQGSGTRCCLSRFGAAVRWISPLVDFDRKIEATLAFLRTHLASCTALGEVGLDYKAKVKKAVQWEVFARVLDLAAEFKKPVIVHARFSHQRCHRMVSAAKIKKAVFHWYSGPLDLLEKIIADGYFVSCTPALAYSIRPPGRYPAGPAGAYPHRNRLPGRIPGKGFRTGPPDRHPDAPQPDKRPADRRGRPDHHRQCQNVFRHPIDSVDGSRRFLAMKSRIF